MGKTRKRSARKPTKRAKSARKPRAKSVRPASTKTPPIVKPSQGILALHGKTINIPMQWYIEPLRKSMRKAIRPPTARTRRGQRIIEQQLPQQAFEEMLQNFVTDELDGLKWVQGSLEPTRDAPNFLEWEYVIRKPSQLNKFFDLATWDDLIEGTLWKRGSGAQVLHLSQAAARRGKRSMLVSSAAGNLCLRLRAPKE